MLSAKQHVILCAPFNSDDVKQALFDIDDTKVVGPKGYSSVFFKKA